MISYFDYQEHLAFEFEFVKKEEKKKIIFQNHQQNERFLPKFIHISPSLCMCIYEN